MAFLAPTPKAKYGVGGKMAFLALTPIKELRRLFRGRYGKIGAAHACSGRGAR